MIRSIQILKINSKNSITKQLKEIIIIKDDLYILIEFSHFIKIM